jgi:FixJ family two-component response regulator
MSPPAPLVAVVEDDAACLRALGRVLRAGGCDVMLCGSAEEALTAPLPRRPACFVVDMQLGAMSGLDLQARLNARGSTVPVIVLTALDDDRTRAEARRLGCVAFLDKGSDIDVLLTIVRGLETPAAT